MKFSLGEAAKQVGHAKSTLSRDIKSGKISAVKNENGSYEIDASELFRVYEPVPVEQDATRSRNPISNDPQPLENTAGTGGLQADVQRLRELLATVNLERDRERRQLESQIEDLRDRLDREGEERRGLTLRLLGPPPSNDPQPPQPSSPDHADATATPQPQSRGLFGLFRRSS